MIRFWQTLMIMTFVSGALCLSACREKAQTNGATPNAGASPAAGTAGMPLTASSPVVLASPVDPTKPISLPAAVNGMPKTLDAIPERLKRPLTLEEINALPPETRDMILRAQGRLPAAGAAAPAKKIDTAVHAKK